MRHSPCPLFYTITITIRTDQPSLLELTGFGLYVRTTWVGVSFPKMVKNDAIWFGRYAISHSITTYYQVLYIHWKNIKRFEYVKMFMRFKEIPIKIIQEITCRWWAKEERGYILPIAMHHQRYSHSRISSGNLITYRIQRIKHFATNPMNITKAP